MAPVPGQVWVLWAFGDQIRVEMVIERVTDTAAFGHDRLDNNAPCVLGLGAFEEGGRATLMAETPTP